MRRDFPKTAAARGEKPAFCGVISKENKNGCVKKANFLHLIDLLGEHPERVAFEKDAFEFYYKTIGVDVD